MEKDYSKEIEALQKQMGEMRKMVAKMLETGACMEIKDPDPAWLENVRKIGKGTEFGEPNVVGHIHKMHGMHPDPGINNIMDRLQNVCGESGDRGKITYLGVYSSGDRQSNWVRNEVSADQLLSLIEDHSAEKVLACIGSSDRLNLLLTLLKSPMSVAELVEQCGYNSTGQVYHHLKPLIAANLVQEDENNRGRYYVISHRVRGILMLLAGISDMLDPTFTQGNWDSEN